LALESDRALVGVLAVEAAPVIEALSSGLDCSSRPEARAHELREGLTLTRLLGRRAEELGASPTAASAVASALVAELCAAVGPLDPLADDLRAVLCEGFVEAREERTSAGVGRRLAEAIPVLEVLPRCTAVLPRGSHDTDELERVLEQVGRRCLERETRVCLVDLGRAAELDEETVRRYLTLHSSCAMLGVRCIFTAVPEGWLAAARACGVNLEPVSIASDFEAGLRVAAELSGLSLRPRSRLGSLLRLARPGSR
jgi:hypothetical protein